MARVPSGGGRQRKIKSQKPKKTRVAPDVLEGPSFGGTLTGRYHSPSKKKKAKKGKTFPHVQKWEW